MEYTLQPWNASNYIITMKLTPADWDEMTQNALKQFQKEVKEPGFREGHVPLDIVQKKVSPQYLEIATIEEAIHKTTKKLIKEHEDKQFIGTIYELDKNQEVDPSEGYEFTFKLDVYPEVVVENDNWKKATVEKIDSAAQEDEIDETIMNLRKQYASYDPAETVDASSVFKVSFRHLDWDTELEKWSAYFGKEDIDEFPILEEIFFGKKENDPFSRDYDKNEFPPMLHARATKEDSEDLVEPKSTEYTVTDIKTMTLPDFTPENIKKFFGNDEVKTEEELRTRIATLIEQQKKEGMLMQAVDKTLDQVTDSIKVTIPKTLTDEELKTRMKSLEERLWGPDWVKKYYEQIWEEKKNEMLWEVQRAAHSSLTKFFVLRKFVELLDLGEVNRQKPMDVEQKVYDKLAE